MEPQLNKPVSISANSYDWLIFKTRVHTQQERNKLWQLLKKYTNATRYTIDLEDIDKVLRVKPTHQLKEAQVIELGKKHGFDIEPLPD